MESKRAKEENKADSIIAEVDHSQSNFSEGWNQITTSNENETVNDLLKEREDMAKPGSKLEIKRERGKQRSKKSRDRKKAYIENLEQRIKELEAENFRLQNLIISYRNDKLDVVDKKLIPFTDVNISAKLDVLKKFIDSPTLEIKESTMSFFHMYSKNIKVNIQKHKEFLDKAFEAIVNHPFPNWKMKYWEDLDNGPLKDLEILQKYSKLSKYQIPEFEKTHKFNKLDIFVASLKLNKRQYEFVKQYMDKEIQLKRRYLKGMKHLLRAKEIFESTIPEQVLSITLLLRSQILTSKQIFESKFKEDLHSRDNAFNDIFLNGIWKISIQKKKYSADLNNCEILGKLSKKYLKESESSLELEYNHFCLP
ncbi:unnamed protein product [Moneuplotes crassus]|uniref:BZIP domain-containing protein n=1 Tax=Euplotes crassus TaxID=5936 RepID=A0AAD1UMV8_EUPCR|nr:unnamed protein product [Moneuplotes crassus]